MTFGVQTVGDEFLRVGGPAIPQRRENIERTPALPIDWQQGGRQPRIDPGELPPAVDEQ